MFEFELFLWKLNMSKFSTNYFDICDIDTTTVEKHPNNADSSRDQPILAQPRTRYTLVMMSLMLFQCASKKHSHKTKFTSYYLFMESAQEFIS